MIYKGEMEVGKEETLQAVIRNNGTAKATNISIGFDAQIDAFDLTLVGKIGPDELSPYHNMSILFKITPLEPGNFTIEPALTYSDEKGQTYETLSLPSINITVSPASNSPLDYLGIVIIPIVIFCIIGIIYLASRKQLERYFRKPR